MIIPKIAICPICGKKTYLRIEDGGYLKEYPIRFHCMNCRALIKGVYIMGTADGRNGIHLYNAATEECEVDSNARRYAMQIMLLIFLANYLAKWREILMEI